MTLRRVAASVALVILVVLTTATGASAHALRIASVPDAGAVLQRGPTDVTITFGEEPDPSLSLITVLDATGGHHEVGAHPTPEPGNAVVLVTRVQNMTKGVYTVTWRTVSKVDGHLATGSYNFGVGVVPKAGTTGASVSSPSPSLQALVGRWLFDGGLLVLIGAAFVAALASTRAIDGDGDGDIDDSTAPEADRDHARRRLLRLAGGAWIAAFVGTIVITNAARSGAGLTWSGVFHHSLGHQLDERAGPLILALLALVALCFTARFRRAERAAIGVLVVALALTIAGEVETAHAAATVLHRWFALLVLAVHVSAAGIWIGGLAAVLVMVGVLAEGPRTALASRYSLTIGAMLVLVALTGSQRAYAEVGSWVAFIHTTFGRWVLVKIILFCVLGALGAYNRYRSLPALRESPRRLLRTGAIELVVAVVVIVATGYLQNLAPSAQASAAAAQKPLVVNGNDAGTTVRVQLSVSPAYPGFNDFKAKIVDYDTHKIVPASGVSVTFTLPARPDVAQSRLNLKHASDGTWDGNGANLSLPGTWSLAMLVQEPNTSVEVPLTVNTRATPQTITKSAVPGQATIYTIHVVGGRSIQVYTDSTRAGLYEVHATFFDATGNELPVQVAHVRARRIGTTRTVNLTARKLDALGHYVADNVTNGGTYEIDTDATAKDGSVISGHIVIPMQGTPSK
ncbi:MAG TPA: copper resistance protein CopC [Acidimicrobiia bacterium]|jgi:copper transport protein